VSEQQLTLAQPGAEGIAFERQRFYHRYWDAGKLPVERKAAIAIDLFADLFGETPIACFCHPDEAAAVRGWMGDVPILAGPVPPNCFDVGPVPSTEVYCG
jgi:hypothetical protein